MVREVYAAKMVLGAQELSGLSGERIPPLTGTYSQLSEPGVTVTREQMFGDEYDGCIMVCHGWDEDIAGISKSKTSPERQMRGSESDTPKHLENRQDRTTKGKNRCCSRRPQHQRDAGLRDHVDRKTQARRGQVYKETQR